MSTGRRLEVFWEVDWAYLSLFSAYVVLVREWRSSVVWLAVGYKSSAEELSHSVSPKLPHGGMDSEMRHAGQHR